jgi:hypothetical protein
MRIIMERKAAVAELIGSGGHILGAEGLSPSRLVPSRDYSIPLLRRWMGNHAVFWVIYKRGIADDELRRLRAVFPEAIFEEGSIAIRP